MVSTPRDTITLSFPSISAIDSQRPRAREIIDIGRGLQFPFQFLTNRGGHKVISLEGVNLHFHGVGIPKATEMKNPRRFSRLVDLRPVEQSRGPSLVKVNTSSRQCIGVRVPPPLVSFFFLSLLFSPLSLSSLFSRSSNSPSFSVATEHRVSSFLLFVSSTVSKTTRWSFLSSAPNENSTRVQSPLYRGENSLLLYTVKLTFVRQTQLRAPSVDVEHRVLAIEIIRQFFSTRGKSF